MLSLPLLDKLDLRIKTTDNIRSVWDIVRKKWIVLTPEEHVRQALLHYFVDTMLYPSNLIAVEKQINYGNLIKRYDIVIHNRNMEPWLLVECKAPNISINQSTLHQLLQYHSQIPCPYWLLSNGIKSFCAQVTNDIKWINYLPNYPNTEG